MTEKREQFAIPEKAARILRKVAKAILAEPRRLVMDNWGTTGIEPDEIIAIEMGSGNYKDQSAPPCGTTACIAGQVLLATPQGRERINYHKDRKGIVTAVFDSQTGGAAAFTLGMPYSKLVHLYYVHLWPSQFRQSYDEAKDAAGRAKVTVGRIEHFIRTGE